MIDGSGTLSEILLCGRTWPPFTKISSFTITSSPSTVIPSILTQRPTMHRQPIIHESSHEWDLMVAPLRIVQRLMQTPKKKMRFKFNWDSNHYSLPSSITTSGPTVTFGPILHPFPIFADGSTITLPTIPSSSYSCDASRCLKELR